MTGTFGVRVVEEGCKELKEALKWVNTKKRMPVCRLCESEAFDAIDGLYYCQNCGTQSQVSGFS